MKKKDSVAFLVFALEVVKGGKRKHDDFDWMGNVGAKVIARVLERGGVPVTYCSPETAHHHKVVLISITSQFDLYNLMKAIGRLTTWRDRSFTAILGGAGTQNVTPLRNLIDIAAFGRGESFVTDLVKAALKGKTFDHKSVLYMEGGLQPVWYEQATDLFPDLIESPNYKWKEAIIGCPKKCLFCHYSWSRKFLSPNGKYEVGDQFTGSVELLFKDLIEMYTEPRGRIITALDGLSERLRFVFGKNISNDQVREILSRLTHAEVQQSAVSLKVFQIVNYPTETNYDRWEFEHVVNTVDIGPKKLCVTVQATPFYPSPMTPSAYFPCHQKFNWRKELGDNTRRRIAAHPLDVKEADKTFFVWYSQYMESLYSHLMQCVIMRATEESDDLINTILWNKKLRGMGSDQKVDALHASFDLEPYFREYMTTEELPTWYLNSYIPQKTLLRAVKVAKKKMGFPEPEPLEALVGTQAEKAPV